MSIFKAFLDRKINNIIVLIMRLLKNQYPLNVQDNSMAYIVSLTVAVSKKRQYVIGSIIIYQITNMVANLMMLFFRICFFITFT